MKDFTIDTLKNGLRIVTVEMPHLHTAEIVAYVGLGGRHELLGDGGVSHFLEHMVFRGTDLFPNSVALERAFESIGGSINASTDMETTSFFSRVHPMHLETGVRYLASMLRAPLLREADMETERRIVREEALEDLNEQGEEINPDTLCARLFWPGHPLGEPLIGTQETMDRFSTGLLRKYHGAYYTPCNTVLVATGRIRREDVRTAAELAFADWRGETPPVPVSAPHRLTQGPKSRWVHDSSSQLMVSLNFHLKGRNHPDAIPLRVLRRILGWGGGSRLMIRLREECGLTYGIDADLLQYAECGTLSIDFAVAPENFVPAMKELTQLLEEIRRQPVSEEERDVAIQSYRYDLEFSRDLPDEMAVRYGWGTLADCRRTLEEDRTAIEAVTIEQIQQVSQSTLIAEAMALVVVGPWQDEDRRQVEQILSRFPES